ncbi:MAG: DUF1013 domain-containing protein [Alphaproteobacteria bacterium]|nr:DUF1013 domain-containing protein [Alphaproteobacteria bacterium]MCK5658919.1 DUF1013 domain-containing protein [Alphaproteobacteria bacterium]
MTFPLMPKATAAWLVDNTALTFDQIAEFCGLHPLEVQALADGDVNSGIMGTSPILSGELTTEELARCEKNTNAKLKMCKTDLPKPRARSKGPRYTPVTKRAEKPGAVLFLIKKYPELADVQVARLVGSTKPTVDAIRNKTHASSSSLKPVDPISIGLCTNDEINKAIKKAQRRTERLSKTTETVTPEPEQNKDETPQQTASA